MSYALIVGSFGLALFIATKSIIGAAIFFVPGLVMLIATLFFYPTVEVGDAGVRVFTFLADSSIRWEEIVRVRSGGQLELFRRKGGKVHVPKSMEGYLQIVEILRKRRPDLFQKQQAHSIQADGSSPSHPDRSVKTALGSGGSTAFRLGFLRKYGVYVYIIPVSILVVWMAVFLPQYRLSGMVSFAFCLAYMILPLFRVSGIRLEQDKLVLETMLDERSLDPNDIRHIALEQLHGRYGFAANQVKIVLYSGRRYNLAGFSDGEEIIYGHLMNWWKGES